MRLSSGSSLLEILQRALSPSSVTFSQLWFPMWKPGFSGAQAFRSLDYLFVQVPTVQRHPPLDSLPDCRENVYLYSAKLQFQFSSFLLLLVPGGQHNNVPETGI